MKNYPQMCTNCILDCKSRSIVILNKVSTHSSSELFTLDQRKILEEEYNFGQYCDQTIKEIFIHEASQHCSTEANITKQLAYS